MKEFVISEVKAETAVLVGLITKTQDEAKTKEYLDELEFLADTAGAVTVKRFTQKVVSPNQTTYVGKGKLEEIKEYIKNEEEEDREVGMVIFDDELSAKQIRNIEQELQVKILDRTSLILDIFAMRAQTAAAKTQVELAQYRYMLPRLQRLWTHLERQGGGSGSGGGKGSVGLRGPGETQLEMDRRIILGRMSLLKERLAEIDKQKTTQRKNRGRMIRVALVGYTNVGKSHHHEPAQQERGVCREQTLCHPRYHRTQGGGRQPAIPPCRYRRIHPQVAYRPGRLLQEHP